MRSPERGRTLHLGKKKTKHINQRIKMKKIEYIAPEMEEIKLQHNVPVLADSGNEEETPSTGVATGL